MAWNVQHVSKIRHITGEDKGECLSHCNLITFSFMNEKIKTPQHFHPALSINI